MSSARPLKSKKSRQIFIFLNYLVIKLNAFGKKLPDFLLGNFLKIPTLYLSLFFFICKTFLFLKNSNDSLGLFSNKALKESHSPSAFSQRTVVFGRTSPSFFSFLLFSFYCNSPISKNSRNFSGCFLKNILFSKKNNDLKSDPSKSVSEILTLYILSCFSVAEIHSFFKYFLFQTIWIFFPKKFSYMPEYTKFHPRVFLRKTRYLFFTF